MRVSTIVAPAAATVLAFSSLASANLHHQHTGVSAHHQDKRTLGLLCGILGGLLGGCQTSSSKYPSKSWQCNGSGSDGWSYDYNGAGRPSWAPSGWLYFGSNKGWHPPKGWGVPSNTWSPPSSNNWNVNNCGWWAPSPAWHYPGTFLNLIPNFWLGLGWHSYNGPSNGWYGSGSGADGWDYDYYGKQCPYGTGLGFKFFGDKFGWGPAKGWNVPSNDYQFPSDCLDNLSLFTWWTPSNDWNRPSGYSCPSFWPSLPDNNNGGGDDNNDGGDDNNDGGDGDNDNDGGDDNDDGGDDNGYPSGDWDCDGSGNDGYDNDSNGATCPYGNGWKYFGKSHGWQPYKGWNVPSSSWAPPTAWYSSCKQATWWAPSSSWHYPSSFPIPSFWIGLGWSGYNWAPSSFVCNGKGNDGYSYDHLGNGLPSGFPSGWLYFGLGPQWQPASGWSIPSKKWSPPGAWSPKYATWWSPKTKWSVPQGFQCPTWWSVSFLSPLGGILSWIL